MKRTKRNEKELIVLANDPSLTGWGYTVINAKFEILATGCIKTSPEHKKRRIRSSDDFCRRMHDLTSELKQVIEEYNVTFIVSELPHGSQSASAMKMVGAVAALGTAIADCLGIPIEWYSEGDCKKELLGKISATKEETIEGIKQFYDVKWTGIKYKDEAIADSLAVFHVARENSPTISYLTK